MQVGGQKWRRSGKTDAKKGRSEKLRPFYDVVERETGLEPATICLEGRCATIALLPHRGRGDRIRTYDPRVPNAVRYQLRYTPTVAAVYPPPHCFVKVRPPHPPQALPPSRGTART